MTIRTRFAPSPTGYLHIGGARTALYAWLYARKHQGQFILRIEDTDTERSTQEAVQAIFDGMHWLALHHDEGPFFQMQRLDRYRDVADQLLKTGQAYRCDCTKERLEKLREAQIANKQKPRYDGHCRERNLSHSEKPHVIRFKNPHEGEVVVPDLVRGRVIFKNEELDDLVLIRSDHVPTYNFSVVVDDHDMQVTHVIRGDDHLNNTPRQINLYHALNFNVPAFAHIPMILGPDGKRLSKRHGAVNVMSYKEEGYLPQALLNYLVRLGWSHGDQEIFSLEEMIQFFDLDHISRSPASFNSSKLLWLNHHYIKTLPLADLEPELAFHLQLHHLEVTAGPALSDIILLQRERCKTMKEMAAASAYFYQDVLPDAALIEKYVTSDVMPALKQFRDSLNALAVWEVEAIQHSIHEVIAQTHLKMGQFAPSVRVAVSGGTVTPALNQTLFLLGKHKTIARLDRIFAG